jgi:hypothetical protein
MYYNLTTLPDPLRILIMDVIGLELKDTGVGTLDDWIKWLNRFHPSLYTEELRMALLPYMLAAK